MTYAEGEEDTRTIARLAWSRAFPDEHLNSEVAQRWIETMCAFLNERQLGMLKHYVDLKISGRRDR